VARTSCRNAGTREDLSLLRVAQARTVLFSGGAIVLGKLAPVEVLIAIAEDPVVPDLVAMEVRVVRSGVV
jgi:hypothetical protein